MSLRLLSHSHGLGTEHANVLYRRRIAQLNPRYYRKSLERSKKVDSCKNIIFDWDCFDEFDYWRPMNHVLRPPPILSITEWADTYRRISTEFAAEPGDWSTAKMPCWRAVMDACSPNDPARKVVVVKPSQSGGTEAAVLNTIGFTMDVNPRSMLIVFPTLELAESFARERLDPMILVCPTLKNKVLNIENRYGGTGSIRRKRYPGGFANLVGANSTSGLSSRPVPIVIMDEVDRCINNAGREGNPTKLLSTRATTFFDRKEIYLSSPARQEDETGILQMYEDSNQQEVQVSCPSCSTYQVLPWDKFDIELAAVPCSDCGKFFRQWEWQATPQRWIEKNSGHLTKGFKIGWFVSPWIDWKELAQEWSEAKRVEQLGDGSLMQVFVNTRLGESYKKVGKRIEVNLYGTRREIYECHNNQVDLPEGVKIVTAAVDTQDTMLVYEIIGWGAGKESWAIEAGDIQGDPGLEDVWKKLDAFVYMRVLHWENGECTRPRMIFIDSGGHKTTEVYKYCKKRHPRVFAIKGREGPGKTIITASKRRQSAIGNWLVMVGSDTLREEFHSRMRVENPGPGFCHFPMGPGELSTHGYDESYFEQLTCEQRILRYDKQGFAQYEWTKNRTESNDYLMCRCYARAALEYLKLPIDTMKRDTLKIPPETIRTVLINKQKVSTLEKDIGDDTTQNIPATAASRQRPSSRYGVGGGGDRFGAGQRSF
jgi:phage terminase large subunit GpA-like protein